MNNKVAMYNDADWKRVLSPERYLHCRLGKMEPKFSGHYLSNNEAGFYHCICCENRTFATKDAMKLRQGWLNFKQSYSIQTVKQVCTDAYWDKSQDIVELPALCFKCDAFLGIVLHHKKIPQNNYYVINSVSVNFIAG